MRPLKVLPARKSPLCGHLAGTGFDAGKCAVAMLLTTIMTAIPAVSEVLPADREAVVSWTQPKPSSETLTSHRVIYQPLGSLQKNCPITDSKADELVVPAGKSSVTIKGLRPYTSYNVSVLAVSGSTKEPLLTDIFSTKEAAPDGPPRALRHSGSATSFEQLTWSDVACELANGQTRSYYLNLHSHDPWETEVHEHNTASTVYKFAHLAPFTRYTAKVFAQNGAGRSRYFASVNFTTASIPPPQPADLLASHVTQSSVRVSWNAPYPPHGVLDHYRLRFWRGNDTAKATEITVAHDECPRRRRFIARNCFTVKGLERSSVYHFSVRAKNKGSSFSPYSMQLVVKTNDSGMKLT
ncbi:hypothetical protein MTO96_031574 [Rhipicephalus appendiculatus]